MRNGAVVTLIVVQFFAGILGAAVADNAPSIATAFLVGTIFCQTSLLGMWSGLGHTHGAGRALGFLAGSAYLTLPLSVGLDSLDIQTVSVICVSGAPVALAALAMRRGDGPLRRGSCEATTPAGLRYSVRHLMLLTLVIACLMAGGRLLLPEIRSRTDFVIVSVIALGHAVVGVAAIWAVFGSAQLVFRVAALLAASGLAVSIDMAVTGTPSRLWFWILSTLIQATFLVASLWLLRSAGYRLAPEAPAWQVGRGELPS